MGILLPLIDVNLPIEIFLTISMNASYIEVRNELKDLAYFYSFIVESTC